MRVKINGHQRRNKKFEVPVDAHNDYTGKVKLTGLKANTDYHYTVTFRQASGKRRGPMSRSNGIFRTAPAENQKASVVFAWGGDLAGQNVCRDQQLGFPVFSTMNHYNWDFFIGLGDMIYADGVCETTGRFGNAQIP